MLASGARCACRKRAKSTEAMSSHIGRLARGTAPAWRLAAESCSRSARRAADLAPDTGMCSISERRSAPPVRHPTEAQGMLDDHLVRLARFDECRLGGALERGAPADLPAGARPGRARGVGRRRRPAVRLQQHPLRHEHPHRRVGPRQDDPLCAPDPRRRPPHLGLRLGRQAPSPELPLDAARERPCRDDRAARRRGPGRGPVPCRRARDRGDPQGRGRGGHADRGRHPRAADAGGPDRRGRRPCSTASRSCSTPARSSRSTRSSCSTRPAPWSTVPTSSSRSSSSPGSARASWWPT